VDLHPPFATAQSQQQENNMTIPSKPTIFVVLNDEETYSEMEGTILLVCTKEQAAAALERDDPLDAHKAGGIAIDLGGFIQTAIKMGVLNYVGKDSGESDG
tara:strand:+ start:307 stop:609 length:303 start_codon:yes stop_codon:yes gene_type:complete